MPEIFVCTADLRGGKYLFQPRKYTPEKCAAAEKFQKKKNAESLSQRTFYEKCYTGKKCVLTITCG